jgi:hemerythrin-like domain-containing protein
MAEALRLLREEHAQMAKLLSALERQIAIIDAGDTPNYDLIRGVLDYCLSYPDLCHHPKEDMVLSRLRARDPAAAERVGDLAAEHERLAALTRRFLTVIHEVLREVMVSRDSVGQVAREFVDAYRRHMDMEEEEFFPVAALALAPEDWAEIDAQLTDAQDPLFGKTVGKGFEALRDELLALDDAEPER